MIRRTYRITGITCLQWMYCLTGIAQQSPGSVSAPGLAGCGSVASARPVGRPLRHAGPGCDRAPLEHAGHTNWTAAARPMCQCGRDLPSLHTNAMHRYCRAMSICQLAVRLSLHRLCVDVERDKLTMHVDTLSSQHSLPHVLHKPAMTMCCTGQSCQPFRCAVCASHLPCHGSVCGDAAINDGQVKKIQLRLCDPATQDLLHSCNSTKMWMQHEEC